jgi:hypothetical protein
MKTRFLWRAFFIAYTYSPITLVINRFLRCPSNSA